jgi:EipB-like
MRAAGGLAPVLAPVLVAVAALLAPGIAGAQMQPHRAEYTLRLGTAVNATRIGTLIQDIVRQCDGWRIRRELSVDASLTPSLKVSFTSRLEGEEPRRNDFAWHTVQVMNGAEREVQGTVEREAGTWRLDRTTPDGPEQSVLPSLTLMPVAVADYLVRRLAQGSEAFPLLLFVPEADKGAFLLDVKRSTNATALPTPPSQRRVEVPGARFWPFTMTVARAGQRDDKPILTLRGRIFDSGILDGLVVDAGVVTVAAHLRDLQMREAPTCPESK